MSDPVHPELDAIREALLWADDDVSAPVVLWCDEPPPPHTRRLMETLGVTIRLRSDPQGMKRGAAMGAFVGGQDEKKVRRSSPSTAVWIDFRASLARVARREEAGEKPQVCGGCGTELDVKSPVHSPRCEFGLEEAARVRPVEESEPSAHHDPGEAEPAEPDMMEEVDAGRSSPEAPAHVDGANNHARRSAWTKETILEAIRAHAAEHGQPPKSDEWAKAEPGRPTTSTVVAHFGKWSLAIESAGFERPVRGGQAGNANRVARERLASWIVVPGRGLRYRTAMEAYVAADEIEADGERVAREARVAGLEEKADLAIDKARELAEEIRVAARAADPETEPALGRLEAEDRDGQLREGQPSSTSHASGRPSAIRHADTHHERPAFAAPEPNGDSSDAASMQQASEPTLRQALAGLLGAAIVVLEAAQRELLVETSAPGERPLRLTVRPR